MRPRVRPLARLTRPPRHALRRFDPELRNRRVGRLDRRGRLGDRRGVRGLRRGRLSARRLDARVVLVLAVPRGGFRLGHRGRVRGL